MQRTKLWRQMIVKSGEESEGEEGGGEVVERVGIGAPEVGEGEKRGR